LIAECDATSHGEYLEFELVLCVREYSASSCLI